MIEPDLDYWEKCVKPYILEQYKHSLNWQKTLKITVDYFTKLNSIAVSFSNLFKLEADKGGNVPWIDFVANIFNFKRFVGESDLKFKERLKQYLSSNKAGTADYVLQIVSDFNGCEKPQFLDECPATFFVYTPEHKKLTREQLKGVAPAGVLGLVGLAIVLNDGRFLGTADGKRILASDSNNVSPENALATEHVNPIKSEPGKFIVTEGSEIVD